MNTEKIAKIVVPLGFFIMLIVGFFIGLFFNRNTNLPPLTLRQKLNNISQNTDDALNELQKLEDLLVGDLEIIYNIDRIGFTFINRGNHLLVESILNPALKNVIFENDKIEAINNQEVRMATNLKINHLIIEAIDFNLLIRSVDDSTRKINITPFIQPGATLIQIDDVNYLLDIHNLKQSNMPLIINLINQVPNNAETNLFIDLFNVRHGNVVTVNAVTRLLLPIIAGQNYVISLTSRNDNFFITAGISPKIFNVTVLVNENTSNVGVLLALALARDFKIFGPSVHNQNIHIFEYFSTSNVLFSIELRYYEIKSILVS